MSNHELEGQPGGIESMTDEEFRAWVESLGPEEARAYAEELWAKLDNGQIRGHELRLLANSVPPDELWRLLVGIAREPGRIENFSNSVLRKAQKEDPDDTAEYLAKLLDSLRRQGIYTKSSS